MICIFLRKLNTFAIVLVAYEDLGLLVVLLSKKGNSNLLSGNLTHLSALLPLHLWVVFCGFF